MIIVERIGEMYENIRQAIVFVHRGVQHITVVAHVVALEFLSQAAHDVVITIGG